MNLSDSTLNGLTAAAALAAVVSVFVAVWTARSGLIVQRQLAEESARVQRELAEEGAREQRRMGHQQFLWTVRSALYSRVLLHLNSMADEVEALGGRIRDAQTEAARSEIRRSFADTLRLFDELRREQGIPLPDRAEPEDALSPPEVTDIAMAFYDLLQLPPDLHAEVQLVASVEAREAIEQYSAALAAPHLFRSLEDADVWSAARGISRSAIDRLREALARELQLDESPNA